MKKNTIFLTIILVCGAFASCLRSDDLEILRHPIHVTGTVSPQYGIPVAQGEMNINDILSHLSADYQGLLVEDEDVVTIAYEAVLSDTIYAFSQIPDFAPSPRSTSTKDGLTWFSKDTIIVDTIDIDFFNDVEFSGQLNMEHIWLDLAVTAYGQCPESVRPHVKATFDNLAVSYEDHDGMPKTFDAIDVEPIRIDDINQGFDHNFERIDVASIANDMPRRIFTSYRFRFEVSSQFITEAMTSMYFGEILDSLRMSKLIYAADLDVTMPMSVKFNNLNYSFDLDLGDGLSSVNLDSIANSISEGISVNIDTSRIRLALDNGIPMEFLLGATLKDANDHELLKIFQDCTIASSNLKVDPDDNQRYMTESSARTILEKKLTADELRLLEDAKTLTVTLRIDTQDKHVTIRRSDYLKIKAYLQVHPSVDIDIAVTNDGIL